MARMIYTLYKNDGSGESKEFDFKPGSTFPDAAVIFNETALKFLKWNKSDDGTSTSYFIGDMIPDIGDYYAIWEAPDPVPYIATDQEIKSIADAIRAKGGTSAALTFPAGFVSAIEAISTGGGGSPTLYVLTQTSSANTGCSVEGHAVNNVATAYFSPNIVEGATITFTTFGDYILETVTGVDSGSTYAFTTVKRGEYTFTMPGESVYCHLFYDD